MMRHLPLVAAAVALLVALPSASAAGPVCASVIQTEKASHGDGTWHFKVTSTHLCAPDGVEGFLSVTDDFESQYRFETCTGDLRCDIVVEGDTYDGNCLYLAAFTNGPLVNHNASQKLCAP